MNQSPDNPLSRLPGLAFAGAAALAAGVSVYALAVEPYWLEVTHPRILCPRLPAALEGLSVLLLADPHIAQWSHRERLLVEALDRLTVPPDLVVFAGDMIQSRRGVAPARRLCQWVRSRFDCPTYAILGNAEHKPSAALRRGFVRGLENDGVRVLINRHEALTLRGETITVAGTDDPYYGHADLDKTLAGAPPGRFTLLLSHSPQIAPLAARAGFVDVVLSGHTHGGQVRLPLIGPLKTQNPLGRKMDCGLFDRARLRQVLGRDLGSDMAVYISRGIGSAPLHRFQIFPRLLCRPEITLLTLHNREAVAAPMIPRQRL